MSMLKIFISFSQKDREIARRLQTDLVDAGADVFQYEFSATPGSPAWKQVVDRLERKGVRLN
jgi:hypothetical protein